MHYTKTLNELCKERKELLKISYHEIAVRADIPDTTVERFFSKDAKGASIHTAGKICAILGYSLDDHYGIEVEQEQINEDLIAQLREDVKKLTEDISMLHKANDDKRKDIERLQSLVDEKNRILSKGHKVSTALLCASLIAIVCLLVHIFSSKSIYTLFFSVFGGH